MKNQKIDIFILKVKYNKNKKHNLWIYSLQIKKKDPIQPRISIEDLTTLKLRTKHVMFQLLRKIKDKK
jgi:hypothetical protein